MPADLNAPYTKIILALAGIFQVGVLVRQLADTGHCDEQAFQTCIHSLFKVNAPDVPSVYGGVDQLKIGAEELVRVFAKEKPNPQVSRYSLSLILLQQQLAKNKEMLGEIRRRVEHTISQYHYFTELNDTIIANFADIYIKSVGSFRYRIQIIGKSQFLHNDLIVNKIRALLLAGIRSAILWQQVGGRRWQLFLQRGKLLRAARKLLVAESNTM